MNIEFDNPQLRPSGSISISADGKDVIYIWAETAGGLSKCKSIRLANLIVAAPDLLENLEHALAFIQQFVGDRHQEKGKCAHCRLIQHMQHAIDKAKGVTSQIQQQPELEPNDQ